MTDDAPRDRPASVANGPRVDSLVGGLSLLLVLTFLQRMLGFGRNLLFCRWLEPEELGRWNLAFSLLVLAAPLVVLGLPGSFGRYVEHYRQKGQLRSFLRRTTWLTLVLATCGIAVVGTASRTTAWLFFGDASQTRILVVTAVCLVAVIGFNFIIELFTALRQVRAVSYLQFLNGILFAVVALGLLHFWSTTATSVVVGYAVACLISCLVAVWPLCRCWRAIPESGPPLPQATLWIKLLPFAAWIWLSDLVSNLFTAADRYMIVHFSSADPAAATEVVGQYHSSLVVPMLLITVASLVASVVLPYVSSDWESGRVGRVNERLNAALKLYGLGAAAAGAVVLVLSPWIFGWALAGKYADGLSVLPWTLTFCVWGGMSIIANSYLLCVERAGTATRGPLAGLVVNVGLNALLLPALGLLGAVLATAAGNAATLSLNLYFAARHGLRLERGTLWVSCLPLCLTLGSPAAVGCVILFLWVGVRSHWVMSAESLEHWTLVAETWLSRWLAPWMKSTTR